MKTKHFFLLAILVYGFLNLNGQGQNGIGLDGIDDYINCGNDASLNITGNITVEAWIYSTAINQNNWRRIIEKDWATSYFLGTGDGGSVNAISFGIDPNGSTVNLAHTSDNVIHVNVWHHVAGTWDGSVLRIYVDGVLSASQPWSNTVDGSTNDVFIGQHNFGGYNFQGYMDEVRIWNTALTETQIRENVYRELENPGSEANLVAYYPLNEGSGQTSADQSQNSNTAIFGGTLAPEPSDPSWGSSTAPIPYFTINDGSWVTFSTWADGQYPPVYPWARVALNNDITIGVSGTIEEATINPLSAVTISSGNLVTINGNLLIRSDASGSGSLINNGTFAYGSATVERFYTGSEWHLISSPISDATSGLFTGLYLQYHNESDNLYYDIIPTNVNLVPGRGYALWNNGSSTAEYTGILNTGTIGSPNDVQRTATGGGSGWNLVGNPYCSAIDWDASSGWTKTNVDNATYRHVNSATWATYVGGTGTNGGTRYIASGQGFFVSVTDPGSGGSFPVMGTLLGTEAIKVHENITPFFKNEINDYVRLEVSGDNYTDETVIRFNDEASLNFDSNWDAYKLFGYVDEVGQIYSNSNQPLSINALPFGTNTVTVGVKSGVNSLFTISATELSNLEYVFLEDTETSTVTDLKSNSYTFSYEAGENDNRFILHFSPLNSIPDTDLSGFNIFTNGNSLHVESPVEIHGQIDIFNITGQLVSKNEIHGKSEVISLSGMGTYIVRVVCSERVITKKVTNNH